MAEDTEFPFWGNSSTIKTDNISNTNHLSAFITNTSEVMAGVSPQFSATNAVVANYFQAFVTYSNAIDTCPLSAYAAFSSNCISSD